MLGAGWPLAPWPAGKPLLLPAVRGEEEQLRELEGEVIECHIIRFSRPVMQKTAYELWLKDQRKAMHLKCARFLEENAHKCDHCRSGDFIPYHHFTVDIRLNTLDMDTIKKMTKPRGLQGTRPSPLADPHYSWERWRPGAQGTWLGHRGAGTSAARRDGAGGRCPRSPV